MMKTRRFTTAIVVLGRRVSLLLLRTVPRRSLALPRVRKPECPRTGPPPARPANRSSATSWGTTPSAGFVTGGGWIDSLAGAYTPRTRSTPISPPGRRPRSFPRHKKGATVPTGQTKFQFSVVHLNFRSTSYDWLVVSGGSRVQYKGTGTINGQGNHGFILTAVDGGTGGVDKSGSRSGTGTQASHSWPGEVVLDACGCTGSMSVAAINLGRRWVYAESNEENYRREAARIAAEQEERVPRSRRISLRRHG